MERLSESFTGIGEVKGVQFKQLFRYNDLCLYERTEIGGSLSYEVVKARYQKAGLRTMGDKQFEQIEKGILPDQNNLGFV